MDKALIERLAREAGFRWESFWLNAEGVDTDTMAAFAALIAEECAKVCDEQRDGVFRSAWDQGRKNGALDCAEAIRAKFGKGAP